MPASSTSGFVNKGRTFLQNIVYYLPVDTVYYLRIFGFPSILILGVFIRQEGAMLETSSCYVRRSQELFSTVSLNTCFRLCMVT